MVDQCLESIPPRVMDLLKMFLAASSRGEQAVLILETRQKTLTTKFRSVEKVAGTHAPLTTPSTKKRRNNPARARRSQLRLEEFTRKKLEAQASVEDQQDDQDSGKEAAGVASSKVLLLELSGKDDKPPGTGTCLLSPILQVDGGEPVVDKVNYTFISDYHEDDILYTLEEIFLENSVQLEPLKQCQPRSADYLYSVAVKLSSSQESTWPNMSSDQAQVFKDLKKI